MQWAAPLRRVCRAGARFAALRSRWGNGPGRTDMRAFGEIAERLRRSTVQVFPDRRGGGSGVIWKSDGVIMTNAHVLQKNAAEVQLWDGRRFPARVISRDARRDLAVLRVEVSGLDAAAV